ncbi:LLM class flavin-dependent oxidoreductase [Sediminicoccus rosea]|jgi:FMN-dependent oxidoreductase (nitrilotriacetate monooxygenase family)|uniref:LLM class flavin-dependent oxidoreductase n=1 Tax=Sediminicoccus rosea TaxID=1225128 RepID=A0ABZ0PH38_9PROT|nr:LLM class flavin-dependent oxidoreductase [Sediminicoccus rosea]WPB85038.1 LLM class flavin-dependent oxidoreductase [Sediminicoccus rosea]
MTAPRQMALATLVQPNGNHLAAWLAPGAQPDAGTDIAWWQRIAQIAEQGKFDLFFIADTPTVRTDDMRIWSHAPVFMNQLEPLTLLSAVAGATKRIGLGATVSTSFSEPYNVARFFASLDHISHGRAAWNVVTSANDFAARNFGHAKLPPHSERYERAGEFVEVVKKLWNSWEPDAFVYDTQEKLTFDPAKFHLVQHEGKHFRVHGGLNIAPAPQGHPVIIQAGASDTGKELAAATAEVVFGTSATIKSAVAFYSDLKGRMAKYGRAPEHLKILGGITVIVGDTVAEAEALNREYQELLHPAVGVMRLGQDLETDLSDLPLDEPVPESRIPAASNHHQAYFAEIAGLIREGLTLRQVAQRYNRSKATLCGTPAQIADLMQEWMEAGACDGFMVTFPVMPRGLQDFVDKVVPELQRRGLFRQDYTGTTLRAHLGLPRPRHPAEETPA